MAASIYTSAAASSYRVKFDRKEFLELIDIAKPRIIYKRKNIFFFAFDGFLMYCDKCEEADVPTKVLDTIQFSNYLWQK